MMFILPKAPSHSAVLTAVIDKAETKLSDFFKAFFGIPPRASLTVALNQLLIIGWQSELTAH